MSRTLVMHSLLRGIVCSQQSNLGERSNDPCLDRRQSYMDDGAVLGEFELGPPFHPTNLRRKQPWTAFVNAIRPSRRLSSTPRAVQWKCNDNTTGWKALLGDAAGSSDPRAVLEYAAPARAENLVNLPPTFIECGQLDIFVFEDVALANRLVQARVPVELHIYPGLPHGYQGLAPNISLTQASLANVLRAIANA
ncbi:hypothetical protein CLAFUW4_03030 [Fulvia fulva]|uniref:Alpha/beta hydrolase fold-3 domain-containing protein n=1 Tax=Passalora fulva TaxID=5499 RepID=A0A9Q8P4S1_PASFU|nr:uncharacterized protein CLAFUR5_03014 [Fulvia fulva]KAK4631683.1 hypothetical protein CLAFUR4_03023 [Fulvia fulva]UJO13258.1 hypothetical protein CLAFUR5_03014 [Fulvia fulva]WPV10991.1 hypothetical protein CLAFUW4_03030 [Fulvia fulva]WPV25582.1 hypothetical protein CLAFUW7_03027 [Fulvia fulva]